MNPTILEWIKCQALTCLSHVASTLSIESTMGNIHSQRIYTFNRLTCFVRMFFLLTFLFIENKKPDHLVKTNTDDIYQPWFVDDLEHQLQTKFSSKGIYQHQFQQMIGEFPSMEVEATIKNAFIKKSRNIKEMLSYFP